MDAAKFTSKERKLARKNLLRKIDTYNKQVGKSTRYSQQSRAFPISSPSKDLIYKGIVKVTYDRGYAIQTKSLLLENTTTADMAVQQLFKALGLRGSSRDYALEERKIMTGENRIVDHLEIPLNLQLNYGGQDYMELRIVQLNSRLFLPLVGKGRQKSSEVSVEEENSNDPFSDGSDHLAPKEEVIDHGVSQAEAMMEDALQDIRPLVHDIQERLKAISESVAVDGKPRSGLPNRWLLWDQLKPQISALVKDIRRLVDSAEFLAGRHCKNSLVVKLIITLLLELMTDHSKELVTIIKTMCGLQDTSKAEFDSSVSKFTQQITYISKLVGKTNDSLGSMAITGHLLLVTSPDNFQSGKLRADSCFTGSKSVSGVLLFTVTSAYLGLIRAAYEEKCEFYVSLATNMLRSSQKALETIQKTEEYASLHFHPLRSRVMNMEQKLRVAMDNLVRRVRMTGSSRPPPDASPEMLQFGYSLIMSTLDFLVVAQCASLTHKVAIAGWELMHFPWVRALAGSSGDCDSVGGVSCSAVAGQLSSIGSDSTSSGSKGGDSSICKDQSSFSYNMEFGQDFKQDLRNEGIAIDKSKEKGKAKRNKLQNFERLRAMSASEKVARSEQLSCTHDLISQPRQSGDGMDAAEMAHTEEHKQLSTDHQMAQYERYYEVTSGDKAIALSDIVSHLRGGSVPRRFVAPSVEGDTTNNVSSAQVGMTEDMTTTSNTDKECSQYVGLEAVRKLRRNYIINKAIAKGVESLLLTLTHKINFLSAMSGDGAREKYVRTVQILISASRQIRVGVAFMEEEEEVLVRDNLKELLDRSKVQVESSMKELQLLAMMASGPANIGSSSSNLLSAAAQLKEISSKTVADALKKVAEDKRALEEAVKREQEFLSLVTGKRQSDGCVGGITVHKGGNQSSALRVLMGDSDSEGIVFEDTDSICSGGQCLVAKEAPRVIAGTIPKLLHRLVFPGVMDFEFNETFLMTFHCFMSPGDLLEFLEERFRIQPPEDLTESERESFTMNIIIPVQLRIVHCLRKWLQIVFDDFKDKDMSRKLDSFITTIRRALPSCGRQLQALRDTNLTAGPMHLHNNEPQGRAPTSLVPSDMDFDLLDVNSLELSRQLALCFSGLLRNIQPQEVLGLGWTDNSRNTTAPHILQFLQMSTNLTKLVCNEITKETIAEQQASIISYFIQTANSCCELMIFEAMFAIVEGLKSREVQQANMAWEIVTEYLKGTFVKLKDLASPELDYQKYKEKICNVHLAPCIPKLALILSELEVIDKECAKVIPDSKELVNFQRLRKFSLVLQHIQRYRSIPYHFHSIVVMQDYLGNLRKCSDNEGTIYQLQ